MKLNSAASIQTANLIFRGYQSSWSAARVASGGRRDIDGALLVPKPALVEGEPPVTDEPRRTAE